MYLCVSGCEHRDNGAERVYLLNDGSSVVEYPGRPAVSRWQFWDNHNHRVFKKSVQSAMKQAAERHKKGGNTHDHENE
ncbi:hypothetical protein [Candidatus Erwinia dacicola]|uniref:Uncharacterized protein n=1 Tax=Candidatus Erwinia dacicola TaxID=252393 RepID=A0A1E7Z021_9GAMM|nr:hypothetical protein [Candidatus Erwinia dacicola]OFC62103.1 hypothetical protein BBW68_10810 [Candidatus Erwinia dacicola]